MIKLERYIFSQWYLESNKYENDVALFVNLVIPL